MFIIIITSFFLLEAATKLVIKSILSAECSHRQFSNLFFKQSLYGSWGQINHGGTSVLGDIVGEGV